jgi:UPF0716 protein FxsA
MGRVFLAGIVTAALEVVVFILVAQWIGLGWAILLVLGTSLLGALMLQRESSEVWRRLRDVLGAGRPPGTSVVDGVVRLGGALLLLVPGLITSAAGALLLIPPVRRLVRGFAARGAEKRLSPSAAGDLFGPRQVRVERGEPASGPTVEGEIVDTEPRRPF